jgi:hypothetical protein
MCDGLASAPAQARVKSIKPVGREPETHELIKRAEESITQAWDIVVESRRLMAVSRRLRAMSEAIRCD